MELDRFASCPGTYREPDYPTTLVGERIAKCPLCDRRYRYTELAGTSHTIPVHSPFILYVIHGSKLA